MSRKITTAFLAAAVALFAASAEATTINFDAGEGYTANPLDTQQSWVTQTQWVVDPTGSGSVSTTSGAFIRAQYGGVQSSNNIGDMLEMSITFSMDGNFGLRVPASTNPSADWQRGILVTGLSDDLANQAPATTLNSGLHLAAGNTNLALWVNGSGSAVDLGAASGYDGHTFVLTTKYTKTSATEYSVDASIDSLDDAAAAFTLSKTNQAGPGAASLLQAAMQALPVAALAGPNAHHYDGVTVSSVTITSTPVPEPTSLSLIGLASLGLIGVRRRS